MCKTEKETQMYRTDFWTLGEGEGGMFGENSIETCILSRVKQITRQYCKVISLQLIKINFKKSTDVVSSCIFVGRFFSMEPQGKLYNGMLLSHEKK